jgi:beta-N-acetylhexosaminidase
LPALPPLSALAGLSPELRARAAEEFGRAHGRSLAALGVNLNFAPVLDLRPGGGRNLLDLNTLIEQRAIASDPAVVADIARAYVRRLEASGVEATLKHFPGLERVRGDTHLFDASLDAPRADLEASDWRPFKEVLAGSNAALMIGHVSLTAIDPGRPASHSKPVIDGLVRKGWNFDGLIITDDLEMGAIYKHDVCRAVVEALNAGADLLLVSYDGTQFYRILACAAAADAKGELDAGMLEKSEARLRKFEDTLPHTVRGLSAPRPAATGVYPGCASLMGASRAGPTCVRGEVGLHRRCDPGEGESPRVALSPNLRMQPLTLTLSP